MSIEYKKYLMVGKKETVEKSRKTVRLTEFYNKKYFLQKR